jgi:hypothetical protein
MLIYLNSRASQLRSTRLSGVSPVNALTRVGMAAGILLAGAGALVGLLLAIGGTLGDIHELLGLG